MIFNLTNGTIKKTGNGFLNHWRMIILNDNKKQINSLDGMTKYH